MFHLFSRGAATECGHGGRPWIWLSKSYESRSGGRFFRRSAAHARSYLTTGFARGYILSPLRGLTRDAPVVKFRSEADQKLHRLRERLDALARTVRHIG